MKRILSGLVASLVLAVSSSAFADTSVGNTIQLPGFQFDYQTSSNSSNGTTFFSANLSNSDKITSAYIFISHDRNDNLGWVSVSFGGVITPSTAIDPQYQSVSIDRHGVSMSASAGIGASQEWIGWDKVNDQPILGDVLSNGNGNATLKNVTVISSNAQYNEYPDYGGEKGAVPAATSAAPMTTWSAYAQWQVRFNDDASAALADSFGSVGVTASPSAVPEPASLGVLSLGVMALIARRRRNA